MKCSGRSAVSGERIEIAFESAIENVDPVLKDAGDSEAFVAPGFVSAQRFKLQSLMGGALTQRYLALYGMDAGFHRRVGVGISSG